MCFRSDRCWRAAWFVAGITGASAASGQCVRFPAHVDYVQTAYGLADADVDGDGDLDLVLSGPTVRVLTNNGHGVFTARTAFTGPLTRVIGGDLDGDGDVDLIGSKAGLGGGLSVLTNRGDGMFDPPAIYGQYVDSLALGDLDGDGDLDAAGAWDNYIYTWTNRGDGSFEPPMALKTGGDNAWLIAIDLNGDGDVDLATANASASQVFILWNRGDGSFSPVQQHVLGDSQSTWCITCADFDGDGDRDLAISCGADPSRKVPARVRVLLNDEDGAFVEGPPTEVVGLPQKMAAGDVDGDGDSDLAVVTFVGQVTQVLLNRGDATFALGETLSGRAYPALIAMADFNLDARLDVAVAGLQLIPPIGYVSVLFNVGCCRADINGDGLVNSTDVAAFVTLYFEDQAAGTLSADFNNDGVSNSTDVSDFIGAWFGEADAGCA